MPGLTLVLSSEEEPTEAPTGIPVEEPGGIAIFFFWKFQKKLLEEFLRALYRNSSNFSSGETFARTPGGISKGTLGEITKGATIEIPVFMLLKKFAQKLLKGFS